MLELVPINNENSCTAGGHTRRASEAFNTEFVCPFNGMNSDKIYPATTGYQAQKKSSVTTKIRKSRLPSHKNLNGSKMITWLGGVALFLAIAIGIKFTQFELKKTTSVSISLAQK